MSSIGSKLQVWNGTSKHTSGGLTKSDLMVNKHGKVVSKAQHANGVTQGKKNLGAHLRPSKTGKGFISSALGAIGLGLRKPRVKRGKGIGSDIGSVVDGIGHLFGLGLPMTGGDVYSSDGGRMSRKARKPRRA